MKKTFLIANAHIDPIWQWELDEGLNCVISTFESALNLLDKYDYVFCHNESLLYEFIERNRPDLFERIKTKIKEGRWHIMGGWYLQPDCNLPCGESFVRQIRLGLRSFAPIGERPTVAANLDSFGHSKGIVQIMVKSGYKGYLFQRPQKTEALLPAEEFNWEGLGGYSIPTVRISNGYNNALGHAADKIRGEITNNPSKENVLVLWGVGNHGGGPSAHDLQSIAALKNEYEGKGSIIHATPEMYFDSLDFSKAPTYGNSLQLTMPGCFTSLSRLKIAHRELESLLYSTEKLLTAAYLQRGFLWNQEMMDEATRMLMLAEFHDVLPGTSIRAGEVEAMDIIGHGKTLLRDLRISAINSFALGLNPVANGEYSVVVFNPHPYTLTSALQFEIMLADQNYGDKITEMEVSVDGKEVSAQLIKERSGIALDWRKRLAAVCTLRPSAVTQIVLREKVGVKKVVFGDSAENFIFDNGMIEIGFGAEGFIDCVRQCGKTVIADNIVPIVLTDSADSWAMKAEQQSHLGTKKGEFRLMTQEESAHYSGTGKSIPPLRVVEDGLVLTKIEGMYRCGDSMMLIGYTFYKQLQYFDMDVRLFFNGSDECIKLDFPIGREFCETEIPYGKESVRSSGAEQPCGKFVFADGMGIANRCACGMSRENGHTYINLVRGAGYAVHPVYDREYVPTDRFVERMDQGITEFSFRLYPQIESIALPREAQAFCEAPYALYMSVSSTADNSVQDGIVLSNPNIILSAHKRSQDKANKMLLRLHNNCDNEVFTSVILGGKELASLRFGAYEIKTLIYDGNGCEEIFELLI